MKNKVKYLIKFVKYFYIHLNKGINKMECEFCKKEFSTKTNLSTHQKTAKYCLELQGKENDKFKCEFCVKLFTSNKRLSDHHQICKDKIKKESKENESKYIEENKRLKNEIKKIERQTKEKIEEKDKQTKEKLQEKDEQTKEKLQEKDEQTKEKLQEKDKQILELKSKLEKFENAVIAAASEPKTTKTTTNVVVNNNTLNLSQEHVSKVLDEHFTKEVAAGGQKGLAKMVCEKMLTGPDGKKAYVCVDSSRQTFEFTNNDGDVERDVKAKKLTKALINSKIQQKAAEVGNQIWTKEDGHVDSTLYEYCSPKVMELACFEKDDSKFRSELSALTSS